MTNFLTLLDVIGWGGTVGLLLFYFLLAKQKVLAAYIVCIIASILWLLVGVLTPLPSLIFMEAAIIVINIFGIRNWMKLYNTIDGMIEEVKRPLTK